jgi:sirohydrochlorin cobaltochelatase
MKPKEDFMKSAVLRLCLLLAIVALCVSPLWAAGHNRKDAKQVGILLVAFGSSEESAQVSFANIDRQVKAAYPDLPVRWAYTSSIIRAKMAKQGRVLDSPEVALAKMQDEGFTHVAVQSLHTIAGEEFDDLSRAVAGFRMMGQLARIELGAPLLGTQADMARVVAGILGVIPAQRQTNEGVLLMGHGTPHPSNAFYAALMFQVQRRDPNVFIGCVEGYPEIDEIQRMLEERKINKVYLMPFMSVAGDHAKNDLAGDAADSWKSVLTRAGFECEAILKGTAEFDDFVSIWVDHLGQVLRRF